MNTLINSTKGQPGLSRPNVWLKGRYYGFVGLQKPLVQCCLMWYVCVTEVNENKSPKNNVNNAMFCMHKQWSFSSHLLTHFFFFGRHKLDFTFSPQKFNFNTNFWHFLKILMNMDNTTCCPCLIKSYPSSLLGLCPYIYCTAALEKMSSFNVCFSLTWPNEPRLDLGISVWGFKSQIY